MVTPAQFQTLEEMDSSQWLADIKRNFDHDSWPAECVRCQTSESTGLKSIRQHSLDQHEKNLGLRTDYILLSGVLDNICNSACQTCNENLSTKIGSLITKNYIKINNSHRLAQLPLDRVVQVDINGGEPSASPNYLKLLENLPPNVKYLRLNTNGSRVLPVLTKLVDRGVNITVTVSLDGIGSVHDYVRWPIRWQEFEKNLLAYQEMNLFELNTWTTVSALNIGDLKNILAYTKKHNIKHSYALLEHPWALSVRYKNYFTTSADVPEELKSTVAQGINNWDELHLFIQKQDQLRNIKFQDFYQGIPK
jgi:sulfatase maturation enzyme AslB (radical SAM superfamily)